jgi:hypothetical protein
MARISQRVWSAAIWMCCSLQPAPCLGGFVTVPDDFGSVRAAMDSGADTVFIRDGEYREIPEVYRAVTLLGVGPRRPRLSGLSITNPIALSERRHMSAIEFVGPVHINTTYNYQARDLEITFADCTLDSGLAHVAYEDLEDIKVLAFTNCRLRATCAGWAYIVNMESDTVDAGVSWGAVNTVSIRKSWFTGGPGRAIDVSGQINFGAIEDNLIENYAVGIYANDLNGVVVDSNRVKKIGDTAIVLAGLQARLAANVVADCGTGARVFLDQVEASGNTVDRARGVGLWFKYATLLHVEDNVIGRCDGSAMYDETSRNADVVVRHNTLFDNGGSAVEFSIQAIENNILIEGNVASFNGEWGFVVSSPQAVVRLGCNDWFGNARGAVAGVAEFAGDLNVDPLFCDVAAGDVSLFASSPLIGRPGCDQVGARGVGCATAAALSSRVTPNPSRGGVDIEWSLADSDETEIRVYDLAGRRLATVASGRFEAGPHRVRWDGRASAGDAAPPGWYIVRVKSSGGDSKHPVLLIR